MKLEPSAPLTAPTDVDVLCLLSAYCTCVSQRRSPLKPRRACDALIPALIPSEAGESRGKKAAPLPVPSPLSPIDLSQTPEAPSEGVAAGGGFLLAVNRPRVRQTVKTPEHRPPRRVQTLRRGQSARLCSTVRVVVYAQGDVG